MKARTARISQLHGQSLGKVARYSTRLMGFDGFFEKRQEGYAGIAAEAMDLIERMLGECGPDQEAINLLISRPEPNIRCAAVKITGDEEDGVSGCTFGRRACERGGIDLVASRCLPTDPVDRRNELRGISACVGFPIKVVLNVYALPAWAVFNIANDRLRNPTHSVG
ncbi:hypothetical protein EHI45_00790 [Rhizobium leguminosarum]|nr:hypothetical protein EHI45_00790 [Rhizobium leguminosarum]